MKIRVLIKEFCFSEVQVAEVLWAGHVRRVYDSIDGPVPVGKIQQVPVLLKVCLWIEADNVVPGVYDPSDAAALLLRVYDESDACHAKEGLYS